MKKLTVVVVNYNAQEYLEECLQSIQEETREAGYQMVVVDNASQGPDLPPLRAKHPSLHLLLNKTNLGFATACNQGLRAHPADFYLLLNPDCRILDGAIDKSLGFLESHPQVGIVGCRVNNPDGSLQLACRRSIPRPSIALYRILKLSLLFPRSRKFARYNLSYLDDGETHEVEAVSGSFLMFRHQVLRDIGYLDESFFLYGEDLDFCYRAILEGWKVFYHPKAQIIHYKRRSSKQDTQTSAYHYYNAMEVFYRKHFARQASFLQNLLVFGGVRLLHCSSRLRQALPGKHEVGSEF